MLIDQFMFMSRKIGSQERLSIDVTFIGRLKDEVSDMKQFLVSNQIERLNRKK